MRNLDVFLTKCRGSQGAGETVQQIKCGEVWWGEWLYRQGEKVMHTFELN